jgi:hypothetical protein
MKKTILAVIVVLIAGTTLLTTQPVFADTTTNPATAQASTPAPDSSRPQRTLSDDEKLILGIIQLNGTSQVITQTQAAALLPIWLQYLALVQSNMPLNQQAQTTSAAPVTTPTANTDLETQLIGLISQTKATLTTDQINTISALAITEDTAMQLLQSLGLQSNPDNPGNEGGKGVQAGQAAQGNPPSGTIPQGVPQGNPPAGTGSNGISQSAPNANGTGKMNGINPFMVQSFVTYLQKISIGEVVFTATPAI